MAPPPSVLLAAITQRTQRLRFGPLVYLLPLYHPLRLAEEISMLDHLSQGRLEVGIGRGRSPIELTLYGQNAAEAESVYEETLEIIKLAFIQERLTFKGQHFDFKDVPIELRPRQTSFMHPLLLVRCRDAGQRRLLCGPYAAFHAVTKCAKRRPSPPPYLRGDSMRPRRAAGGRIAAWGFAVLLSLASRIGRLKRWRRARLSGLA